MSSSRDFLGPYRLIRLIRSGRRCNVWEAQKTQGRSDRVACKVVLEEYRNDKSEIEQLKNEALVGVELNHPNVIKIFEFVDYSTPFIVMQLFNARNLKQEIREQPDQVAINVSNYIEKCSLGLDYLHSQGWLHCDVKPDNFLVNDQGDVKLIDFSIAKSIKPGNWLARMLKPRSVVQGTRSYMAPEQIRGRAIGPPTDIYGFGCVIHEMLAGKPPFTGVNADDLLMKHLRAPPPSLQAFNKSVSDKMSKLVARMLAKDPAKRPQSFDEFLKEFKRTSVYRAGMAPKLKS